MRLRSSTSVSISNGASASRAICVRRQVFDISPGQVPSLRSEPQISRMRERVDASFCLASAASKRFLIASHSTESSNSGAAKPSPAFSVNGDFFYQRIRIAQTVIGRAKLIVPKPQAEFLAAHHVERLSFAWFCHCTSLGEVAIAMLGGFGINWNEACARSPV